MTSVYCSILYKLYLFPPCSFLDQLVDVARGTGQEYPEAYGPLHLIGHSLGAHICGCAAKEVRRRERPWLVRRITGLDPAQPCFKHSKKVLQLDQNDAPFVDIIHTNGRVLSKLGLGLPNPIGITYFCCSVPIKIWKINEIFVSVKLTDP